MRLVRPFLRLGGWLVVVIAPIVALFAFLIAANPETSEPAIAWVAAAAAILSSVGVYWLLGHTAGETDDPGARYQPTSVLGEMAVPLLTKINEGSRPFTRGGVGIVTFGVWLVAIMVFATVWAVVALLLGLIMVGISRVFEAVGIVPPDALGWLAALVVLIVPIAAAILVFQWARRRPEIRYWLR
jgi:hypothetical protein